MNPTSGQMHRWPQALSQQRTDNPAAVSSSAQKAAIGSKLLILVLLLLCALAACATRPAPMKATAQAVTAITLHTPAVIQAGTPITVFVTSAPPSSGQIVRLTAATVYGPTVLQSPLQHGRATFSLPPAVIQTAGQVHLVAQVDRVQQTETLLIEAGAPVEPLPALAGPRSLTADAQHWAMLVAIPQDHYHNPVADGTAVRVRALHPTVRLTNHVNTHDLEEQFPTTKHLIAWARIYTRTKAGRLRLTASADAAHSYERTVLAVPGAPLPFTLTADPTHLIADGQQWVTVHTGILTDRFANPLLDGVNVMFVVEDPNSTVRSLPAQLMAGQATVNLQAPTTPGPLRVRAFVLDTYSHPLTLTFSAGLAVEPFPVTVTIEEKRLKLQAGPLLGELGQYIPDGSRATFQLTPTLSAQPAATSPSVAQETQPWRRAAHAATLTVTAQVAAGFAVGYVQKVGLPPGEYAVTVTVGAGQGQTTFVLPE